MAVPNYDPAAGYYPYWYDDWPYYGAQVVVRAGLNAGDRVIVNPPVDLAEGMRVAAADADQDMAARPEQAAAAVVAPRK